MSNHAPGPWKIGGFAEHPVIVDANEKTVAGIICHGHSAISSYPSNIDKANASLIAEAPALLHYLKVAVEIIKNEYPEHEWPDYAVPWMEETIKQAEGGGRHEG